MHIPNDKCKKNIVRTYIDFRGGEKMKLSEMEGKKSSSEEEIKNDIENLKGLSHEELMGRLLKQVAEQKSQGTFDYERLRQTIEQMKMYMPETLYQNIIKTLESLR